VREERVLLEQQPDPPLVGRQEQIRRRVEPDLVVERDPPGGRPDEPGDPPQDGRLPRARRPDQRDRPLDVER
jgi:hypothetical protein